MLFNRSESFFVIRFIFKAAFVRRPGPYKSDKAPGDGDKKSQQDKQDYAVAYHKNTFQVKKRIPKKLEQGKPPSHKTRTSVKARFTEYCAIARQIR